MERYKRIAQLPRCWAEGSPVLLERGALLYDAMDDSVLLQLKFRNLSPEELRGLSISVECFDTFGKCLPGVDEFKYQGMNAAQGEVFGDRKAIPLPDNSTQRCVIHLQKAIGASGRILEFHGLSPEEVPAPPVLGEPGLQETLKRVLPDAAANLPLEGRGYWICSCGAFNLREWDKCLYCRHSREEVFQKASEEWLREETARFRQEEEERLRKEAEDRKRQAKAARKQFLMAVCLALVIYAGYQGYQKILRPEMQYREALRLMENEEMALAAEQFEQLGEYRDAAALAEDCLYGEDYEQGLAYMAEERYAEAANCFDKIRFYKDGEDLYQEARFQQAKQAFNKDRKTVSAYINIFTCLDDVDEETDGYEEFRQQVVEEAYNYVVESYREKSNYTLEVQAGVYLKLLEFDGLRNYKDTYNYRLLFEAHQASSFQSEILMDDVWPHIAILADEGFEDAAEIIKTTGFTYYRLAGHRYVSADGYWYFEMKNDSDRYTSYNIPWYDGDYYEIEGNILYQHTANGYVKNFRFDFPENYLDDQDNTLDVYCYIDGRTYRLEKQW